MCDELTQRPNGSARGVIYTRETGPSYYYTRVNYTRSITIVRTTMTTGDDGCSIAIRAGGGGDGGGGEVEEERRGGGGGQRQL